MAWGRRIVVGALALASAASAGWYGGSRSNPARDSVERSGKASPRRAAESRAGRSESPLSASRSSEDSTVEDRLERCTARLRSLRRDLALAQQELADNSRSADSEQELPEELEDLEPTPEHSIPQGSAGPSGLSSRWGRAVQDQYEN